MTSTAWAKGCGVVLLFMSWLFPPCRAVINGLPAVDQDGAGFRSAFAGVENWSDNRTFAVNWPSLMAVDLGILLVTAGAVAYLQVLKNARPHPVTEAWRMESKRRQVRLHGIAVAAGLTVLVSSWFFPPWTASKDSITLRDQRGAGFRYLFEPREVWSDGRVFSIDWQTLAIINLGILLATAGTLVSIKSEVV